MKSLSKTVVSAAIISALVGCGGSGGGASDTETLKLGSSVQSDDINGGTGAVTGGEQSISLKGVPGVAASNDFSIQNSTVTVADTSISYHFDVTDTAGEEIPLDRLSVALEVAASGSFEDSYRMPLFDIREADVEKNSGYLSLTARSAAADLPAGSYIARLVVNPNWQYSFDSVPQDTNDNRPFRYIEERDYSNNASNTFQINVSSTTECVEDAFEDNDSIGDAVAIPSGGQVSASLCLDDVDFYSVVLGAGESTSLTFDYTDSRSNPNPATRYIVLDSSFNRTSQPGVARESNRIVITAQSAGQYYLALYGQRSSYRITHAGGLAGDATNDSLFHPESLAGPTSWMYGDIVLHRLALTEVMLNDQAVNCGRISTQFRDGQPVSYVTPQHFADIHEFRFLSGGDYLVDAERHKGWHIEDGDIVNRDWYTNGFPGYAEKVENNSWRYWSADGLAYVTCTLEINQ